MNWRSIFAHAVGRMAALTIALLCFMAPGVATSAKSQEPGHRATVDSAPSQPFLRYPRLIVAQIRPRGAFLGDRENNSQLHPLWFIAGVYVLAGLVFGALCAQLALHRGLNSTGWFAAGFLFNLFGYVAMLLLPGAKIRSPDRIPRGLGKFHATASPVTCTKCGAEHHPTAKKCAGCGLELRPAVESEVTRIGLGEPYVKHK
ncbi:MAG: hypothetical protein GZ088_15520 [Acidipila sp.]|nr:hypothetical protein [Acidipila sp.]